MRGCVSERMGEADPFLLQRLCVCGFVGVRFGLAMALRFGLLCLARILSFATEPGIINLRIRRFLDIQRLVHLERTKVPSEVGER